MEAQTQDTKEESTSSAGSSTAESTQNQSHASIPPVGETEGSHKTLAILGYILPFLFFLPLVHEESKKDTFARFHANQHLILLIALIVLYIAHSVFWRSFMMGGSFIIDLLQLAYLVLVIIGIIHAAKGEMKELPFVGGFTLLK